MQWSVHFFMCRARRETPPMASPWQVSQRGHVHEKNRNPLHSAFIQQMSFDIMEIVMFSNTWFMYIAVNCGF